jgi:hypothetical protein
MAGDLGWYAGNVGGGAAQGAAYAGLPGALVGGGVGLLGSLLGDSPEEQRRKRMQSLVDSIKQQRAQALTDVGAQTSSNIASATSGGRRRSIASGRDTQAESFIAPLVNNAQTVGANTMTNVMRGFDQQLASVEGDYAARPMEPSLMETLGGAASNYMNIINQNKYMDILKDMYGRNKTNPIQQFGMKYGLNQGLTSGIGY